MIGDYWLMNNPHNIIQKQLWKKKITPINTFYSNPSRSNAVHTFRLRQYTTYRWPTATTRASLKSTYSRHTRTTNHTFIKIPETWWNLVISVSRVKSASPACATLRVKKLLYFKIYIIMIISILLSFILYYDTFTTTSTMTNYKD